MAKKEKANSGMSNVIMVPLSEIQFNDWNPNRFTDYKFQELVKEVMAEGIDQPVIGFRDPKTNKIIISDGEHRARAAQSAGLKEIPVVLKDWDIEKAKIETVRRNVLRGELDKARFTDLVNSLAQNDDVDNIIRNMALTDEEFNSLYVIRQDQESKLLVDANIPKEKALYEDVNYIIQRIMSENKENIEQGYVFFMFKGALILCLEIDRDDKNKLVDMVTNIKEKGKSLQKVLVSKLLS